MRDQLTQAQEQYDMLKAGLLEDLAHDPACIDIHAAAEAMLATTQTAAWLNEAKQATNV